MIQCLLTYVVLVSRKEAISKPFFKFQADIPVVFNNLQNEYIYTYLLHGAESFLRS